MKYKNIIDDIIGKSIIRMKVDRRFISADNTLLCVLIYDLLFGNGLKDGDDSSIFVSY